MMDALSWDRILYSYSIFFIIAFIISSFIDSF